MQLRNHARVLFVNNADLIYSLRLGESFSRSFKEMVRMCLQKEARKRPTVHTLLNCKFFKIKRSVSPIVDELLCRISNVSATLCVNCIFSSRKLRLYMSLQMPDESNLTNERGQGALPINVYSLGSTYRLPLTENVQIS